MFYDVSGEIYREILKEECGSWLISYENPVSPKFVLEHELRTYKRIEPPMDYLRLTEKEPTDGQLKRLDLIEELVENTIYISDKQMRNQKIKDIANREGTTVRRIQKLFYRQLAGRSLVEERKVPIKELSEEKKAFRWAIEKFYYSAKKMSLKNAYDLMLLSKYTDADGCLMPDYPTWHSFRHYFYERNYHRKSRSSITRNGLSNFQRNERLLYGSAMAWKDKIGAFQMDATQADIYLVSRLDRTAVIGRPNVYMAVDTVTQLIAGIYVGLDAGEQAVISCLANAAMDKVEYCRQYGIEISKEVWPNEGLPGEIITDKGREFIGNRMNELIIKYGIEFESLPPFRPDGKSLVEKNFDLIQEKYKPLLRGKGVIEPDSQERWAIDYRSQATLTLEEFTKVVIHCVLYLNSCRILSSCPSETEEITPIAAERWKWYTSENQSMMIPVNTNQLYQFGLPRKYATLSRKGINNNGLWYVSADYKKLLEHEKIGEKVQIAYDTDNVDRIFLVEGIEYIPFCLADYEIKYAGATKTEYEIEKEKYISRRQELEQSDTQGRIRVLQSIQEVLDKTECLEKDKIDTAVIQTNKKRELI
jgi:hypothetical protein